MGDFFRGESENLEIEVKNLLLNNYKINEDASIGAKEIAEKIRSIGNKEIKDVIWTGRDYSTQGDIRVEYTDGSHINYEIKYVAKGMGTAANIGQDSLTYYNIFNNAISWSDFRKKTDFEKKVIKELSQVDVAGSDKIKTKSDIAKIATWVKSHNKKIKDKISEIAREDKLNYIKYLLTKEFDEDKLYTFYLNIISGNTTTTTYKRDIAGADENYLVIVYNKIKRKVFAHKPTAENKDKFTIEQNKNKGTGLLIKNNGITIMTIQLNWKNVFQGIKTPCLNVFIK